MTWDNHDIADNTKYDILNAMTKFITYWDWILYCTNNMVNAIWWTEMWELLITDLKPHELKPYELNVKYDVYAPSIAPNILC